MVFQPIEAAMRSACSSWPKPDDNLPAWENEIYEKLGSKLSWAHAVLLAGSAVTLGGVIQKALLVSMEADMKVLKDDVKVLKDDVSSIKSRFDDLGASVKVLADEAQKRTA